jgi:hypothetical protein
MPTRKPVARIEAEQVVKGVDQAMWAWLQNYSPITVPGLIEEATNKAFTSWLNANKALLLEAIAAEVGKAVSGDDDPAQPVLMTRLQKHRLVRAFTSACELAYRRGFHQGFVVHEENPRLTAAEIAEWRSSEVEERCSPPPGSGGHQPTPLFRMLYESREHGQVIQDFIEAEPSIKAED